MPVTYKKDKVLLSDIVAVEDAEGMLEWLLKKPAGKVDLAGCTHLHPANLQVLMAARSRISAWPRAAELQGWLQNALKIE